MAVALAWALTAGCSGGNGTPESFPDDGTADLVSWEETMQADVPADLEDEDGIEDAPGEDVVDVPPVETDAPTVFDSMEIDQGIIQDLALPDQEAFDGTPTDNGSDLDVTDAGPLTATQCLEGQLPATGVPTVDYDQFGPVLGTHCKGTNHQVIEGVQRVVFAGDSITTGTPPTATGDWYRNIMAAALTQRFGLDAPGLLWKNLDLFSGVTLQQSSGDFWSCAKFGARTDDMTDPPHQQLITCNPPEERSKTTLIVMTVGGNDIFAWAQDLVDGVPIEQLWLDAEKAVTDLEESIHWAVDDPATFPNGVFVVFANTFEFTDLDSASDLATCPGAGIISMDWGLVHPDFLELATWFTTEYMRIAVETGTDMIFFGEAACGHGYMKDDPEGRCYKGPDASLWLDITCMHPGAAGHAGIADLFMAVIDE